MTEVIMIFLIGYYIISMGLGVLEYFMDKRND